jgi:hypothetical protein
MWTGILLAAALFAIYGFLRPRGGCAHNCGMCTKTCGSTEPDDHA